MAKQKKMVGIDPVEAEFLRAIRQAELGFAKFKGKKPPKGATSWFRGQHAYWKNGISFLKAALGRYRQRSKAGRKAS